jgi:hypothetical protein
MQVGLYTNKAYIWPEDLRHLTQSAVFLAETIYVPSTIRPAPVLTAQDRVQLMRKLLELHEIHALRFWEIEGTKSLLPSDPDNVTLPVDDEMSRKEYAELHEKTIERLMENRMFFLKSETQASVEGIAEIVRGKHVLWSFALKDFFRANDILLDATNADSHKIYFSKLIEPSILSLGEAVIEEVAMKLHIPDVSLLSTQQIEECRVFMPKFRDELLKKITAGGISTLNREELIRTTANAIVDRFIYFILEKTVEMQNADQTVSRWSLSQLFFPQEVKDNSDRFFKWENQKESPAPELLLWKLKSEFSSPPNR